MSTFNGFELILNNSSLNDILIYNKKKTIRNFFYTFNIMKTKKIEEIEVVEEDEESSIELKVGETINDPAPKKERKPYVMTEARKEAFEKARQKRDENIKNRKAQQKQLQDEQYSIMELQTHLFKNNQEINENHINYLMSIKEEALNEYNRVMEEFKERENEVGNQGSPTTPPLDAIEGVNYFIAK